MERHQDTQARLKAHLDEKQQNPEQRNLDNTNTNLLSVPPQTYLRTNDLKLLKKENFTKGYSAETFLNGFKEELHAAQNSSNEFGIENIAHILAMGHDPKLLEKLFEFLNKHKYFQDIKLIDRLSAALEELKEKNVETLSQDNLQACIAFLTDIRLHNHAAQTIQQNTEPAVVKPAMAYYQLCAVRAAILEENKRDSVNAAKLINEVENKFIEIAPEFSRDYTTSFVLIALTDFMENGLPSAITDPSTDKFKSIVHTRRSTSQQNRSSVSVSKESSENLSVKIEIPAPDGERKLSAPVYLDDLGKFGHETNNDMRKNIKHFSQKIREHLKTPEALGALIYYDSYLKSSIRELVSSEKTIAAIEENYKQLLNEAFLSRKKEFSSMLAKPFESKVFKKDMHHAMSQIDMADVLNTFLKEFDFLAIYTPKYKKESSVELNANRSNIAGLIGYLDEAIAQLVDQNNPRLLDILNPLLRLCKENEDEFRIKKIEHWLVKLKKSVDPKRKISFGTFEVRERLEKLRKEAQKELEDIDKLSSLLKNAQHTPSAQFTRQFYDSLNSIKYASTGPVLRDLLTDKNLEKFINGLEDLLKNHTTEQLGKVMSHLYDGKLNKLSPEYASVKALQPLMNKLRALLPDSVKRQLAIMTFFVSNKTLGGDGFDLFGEHVGGLRELFEGNSLFQPSELPAMIKKGYGKLPDRELTKQVNAFLLTSEAKLKQFPELQTRFDNFFSFADSTLVKNLEKFFSNPRLLIAIGGELRTYLQAKVKAFFDSKKIAASDDPKYNNKIKVANKAIDEIIAKTNEVIDDVVNKYQRQLGIVTTGLSAMLESLNPKDSFYKQNSEFHQLFSTFINHPNIRNNFNSAIISFKFINQYFDVVKKSEEEEFLGTINAIMTNPTEEAAKYFGSGFKAPLTSESGTDFLSKLNNTMNHFGRIHSFSDPYLLNNIKKYSYLETLIDQLKDRLPTDIDSTKEIPFYIPLAGFFLALIKFKKIHFPTQKQLTLKSTDEETSGSNKVFLNKIDFLLNNLRVNFVTQELALALFMAIEINNNDRVKKIIALAKERNEFKFLTLENRSGNTPLAYALALDNESVVKPILEYFLDHIDKFSHIFDDPQPDDDKKPNEEKNAKILAFFREVFKYLNCKNKILIPLICPERRLHQLGLTSDVLFLAIEADDSDIVKNLLKNYGIDLLSIENEDGFSPLCYAALQNKFKAMAAIIDYLIEQYKTTDNEDTRKQLKECFTNVIPNGEIVKKVSDEEDKSHKPLVKLFKKAFKQLELEKSAEGQGQHSSSTSKTDETSDETTSKSSGFLNWIFGKKTKARSSSFSEESPDFSSADKSAEKTSTKWILLEVIRNPQGTDNAETKATIPQLLEKPDASQHLRQFLNNCFFGKHTFDEFNFIEVLKNIKLHNNEFYREHLKDHVENCYDNFFHKDDKKDLCDYMFEQLLGQGYIGKKTFLEMLSNPEKITRTNLDFIFEKERKTESTKLFNHYIDQAFGEKTKQDQFSEHKLIDLLRHVFLFKADIYNTDFRKCIEESYRSCLDNEDYKELREYTLKNLLIPSGYVSKNEDKEEETEDTEYTYSL